MFRKMPFILFIITEDALSAKGPYLKKIKEIGAHFIVNVNPTENPSLFEWLRGMECLSMNLVMIYRLILMTV